MRRRAQEQNRGLLVNYPAAGGQPHESAEPQTQDQQDFREELDRILASSAFRSSESLRRLLAYLGGKYLSSETDGLKEYTIGVEAFGKPSHYDPQSDPAVRVLASKLRRKLEEYYLKEAAGGAFQLSMPKGHYTLELKAVAAEQPAPAVTALEFRVRFWRWTAAALAAIAVLSWLIVLSMGLGTRQSGPVADAPPWTPEFQLIWGPFVKGDRATVISLGTPLFAKFRWGFVRNPIVNEEQQLTQSAEVQLLAKQFGGSYVVPANPYTGTGEAMGAFLLARLLHGHVSNLILVKSTTLTWGDLRNHNVIFMGAPKLNPLLKEMPMQGGFVLRDGAVHNENPGPGEPTTYQDSWSPDHTDLLEDYALITRLRGLHDSGEIMRIEAGSTEATWAAVEYATQPKYTKALVARVGLREGALPDRYQVLVRARFKKFIPVEITYTTHRVLH